MPLGDPLRDVQPGEPLRFQAATVNAWNRAARQLAATRNRGGGGSLVRDTPPPGLVLVSNGSGSDVDRFGVLGISGVVIAPTDNADGFAERVALAGVTPTSDHTSGKFVVLLEPIANGAVGLACAGGVTVAKVDVDDAAFGFAEAESGNAGALNAAASGTARILWKESGTGAGKWAVIRFGGGGKPGMFPVNVSQTGGSNGTQTTAATYTYTVTDAVTSESLGSSMSPVWARTVGAVTAATHGMAYRDASGDVVLYQVDEVPETEDCG